MGYEGPYDLLVAPDDAEKGISQREGGRTVTHAYEVWTGPTPLLSQRDFIVKKNGDRYSIGPVRVPSNRGMILQQHFNIGHLDEQDIRYRVPLSGTSQYALDHVQRIDVERYPGSEPTDKPNIPEERQEKGLTGTWENITYLLPLVLLPWEILRSLIHA